MKEFKEKMTKKRKGTSLRRFVAGCMLGVFCLGLSLNMGNAAALAAYNDSCTVRQEKIAEGTQYETTLYVIESHNPGPTVLVTGGVHGNEPAGYKAAAELIDEEIKCGTLLVLPNANQIAIDKNLRSPSATGNLNRKFPTTANGSAEGTLAKAILAMMKDYEVDWVLDLHEGANYSKLSSTSSVGQSVIYYPSGEAASAAKKIVSTLNERITTSYRQFQVLKYPAKGSLARAGAIVCGANSMIIETCTRDTLNTRIERQLIAVDVILERVGMK